MPFVYFRSAFGSGQTAGKPNAQNDMGDSIFGTGAYIFRRVGIQTDNRNYSLTDMRRKINSAANKTIIYKVKN